jgi:hypothetical protein
METQLAQQEMVLGKMQQSVVAEELQVSSNSSFSFVHEQDRLIDDNRIV